MALFTKKRINRELTIGEIFSSFPHKSQRLAQEMTNAGLHCAGCNAATWETLEAGVLGHGMGEEVLDQLIERLNAILEEQEPDPQGIHLTAKAAKKFLHILEMEKKHGWGLRFGEKLAGCNGYEFILDFSEKASEDDATFHSHGVNIYVKNSLLTRLLGSEIDYVEGLSNAGFKVTNPGVKSSCGCGTSHGY